MGQRGIQVSGLGRDFVHKLLVGVVVDGAHERQAVNGHDEDHAHVLGKREQQFVEVLVLHGGLLLVERCHVQQSVHHVGDVVAKQLFDARHVQIVAAAQVVDHRGDDHRAVRSNGVTQRECRVQVAQHGVQPILVAAKDARHRDALLDEAVHRVDVPGGQLVAQPIT